MSSLHPNVNQSQTLALSFVTIAITNASLSSISSLSLSDQDILKIIDSLLIKHMDMMIYL